MLRITVHPEPGVTVIRLEGRLAGPWVRELERVWLEEARHPAARYVLDLRDVTAIDDAGRYLLTVIHRDGAGFLAVSPLIRSLIDEMEAGTERPN